MAFILFFLCRFLFSSFFLYCFLCSATGSACTRHYHHPLLGSLVLAEPHRIPYLSALRVEAARKHFARCFRPPITERSRTTKWHYRGNHFFSQEKAGFSIEAYRTDHLLHQKEAASEKTYESGRERVMCRRSGMICARIRSMQLNFLETEANPKMSTRRRKTKTGCNAFKASG